MVKSHITFPIIPILIEVRQQSRTPRDGKQLAEDMPNRWFWEILIGLSQEPHYDDEQLGVQYRDCGRSLLNGQGVSQIQRAVCAGGCNYWSHECEDASAILAEVASWLYECIRGDCCGVSQKDAAVLYIAISYTYMHILQDPMHICIIILQYPIYVYIVQI